MNPNFVMTSRWRLQAEAARVWPLIGHSQAWAQWLPSIEPTPEHRNRLRWHMPWPWAAEFEIAAVQSTPPQEFTCQLHGPLRARWSWLLEAQASAPVDLTLRVEICLDRPWRRRLSPLLLPWLAQRHFAALRAGVPRLGRLLACEASRPSEWAGHTRV